jgi:dihydroorotase
MSCLAAKIWHLPGGTLAQGSLGDVTVFDPKKQWVVDPKQFKSKGRNTPYGGHTLTGQAVCTIVGGKIVHQVS